MIRTRKFDDKLVAFNAIEKLNQYRTDRAFRHLGYIFRFVHVQLKMQKCNDWEEKELGDAIEIWFMDKELEHEVASCRENHGKQRALNCGVEY